MSWLSSFLHPEKGYQKGQEQLDKYYNQANAFQQPYNQHGQEQYGNLSEFIKQLMNPGGLRDQWEQGYTTSDAAKNAQGEAQQHGLDAASSMGLLGSTPALDVIQRGTSRIGAEDKQNYLSDLMQKYLAGAGIAGNVYGVGANTANNQAGNALNMGQNSAGLAYGKENAGGNLLSQLLGQGVGLGGGLLSNYLSSNWNLKGREAQ